jgi:peptide/nickel transport system permease protein
LREQLGLDRPIGVQYVDGFRHLLHGDLGQSLQNGSPVGEEIAQRLPRTLELIGAATVLDLIFGVPSDLLLPTTCRWLQKSLIVRP